MSSKQFKLVKKETFDCAKDMPKKIYKRWLVMKKRDDNYEDYEDEEYGSNGFASYLISYGDILIHVLCAFPGENPDGLTFIDNEKTNIPIFFNGDGYIEVLDGNHTKVGLRIIKHKKKFERFDQTL